LRSRRFVVAGRRCKPVFFVHNLASVRAVASAHGGTLEPPEMEWSFNGVVVCDAVDPEGNLIQFRETGGSEEAEETEGTEGTD
jgi:predicted enzyme related to lactoylglutathione lyase